MIICTISVIVITQDFLKEDIMKKRLLTGLLILAMAVSAVSCGKGADGAATSTEVGAVYSDSTAALTAVWDGFSEQFPTVGGSFANPVDNAPGAIDTSDTDFMASTLLVPEDVQSKVTEAASLLHMMNANTFTGVALKMDGMDATATAEALKTNFKGTQFMCGMPDKIVVVALDGYVVYSYGEAGIVDEFKSIAEGLGAEVLVDENFA